MQGSTGKAPGDDSAHTPLDFVGPEICTTRGDRTLGNRNPAEEALLSSYLLNFPPTQTRFEACKSLPMKQPLQNKPREPYTPLKQRKSTTATNASKVSSSSSATSQTVDTIQRNSIQPCYSSQSAGQEDPPRVTNPRNSDPPTRTDSSRSFILNFLLLLLLQATKKNPTTSRYRQQRRWSRVCGE